MTFTRMGYLYQQVCSIFKFESFNPARIRRRAISKTRNTGTTEQRYTGTWNTGTASISFRNTEHRNTKNS